MSNKGFIKKRRFDWFILICILTILIIGLLIDMGILTELPTSILIRDGMRENIMLYVFAAQVSVSTLGIALIAILGGIANDTIYGINITQYLMEDRPLIFKHKVNIIVQLILIVFSYIFMSLEGFNLLTSTFFISILINGIMVWDVFMIFYGSEYIRTEIYGYFIEVFSKIKLHKNNKRESLLNGIKKDTLMAIDNNNTVELKENLNLYIDILNNISGHMEDENSSEIANVYEDDLSNIFNKMLKGEDLNNTVIALESMYDLYRKSNEINRDIEKNHNNIYLNILDKVSRYFFISVSNLVSLDNDDYYIMYSLQTQLYDNLHFKEIDDKKVQVNNTYLSIYSVRIYYEIMRKNEQNYNAEKLLKIKVGLYEKIEQLISYNQFTEFKDEKIEALYNQLYRYTKVLIDNSEIQVLKDTFFDTIRNIEYRNGKKDKEYIFIIIIYIYYLVNFEVLVDEKLKNNCIKLLQPSQGSEKNSIGSFLDYMFDFTLDEVFIDKANQILGTWEVMPKKEAKCLVMDEAIYEFVILYKLKCSWDTNMFINYIKPVVLGREFTIYSSICTNNEIQKKYNIFVEVFFGEHISEEELQDKIHMLKQGIEYIYKEGEIKRSKENIKDDEYYNKIKNKIKDKCFEIIEEKTKYFNLNKVDDVIHKNVPLLELKTEISLLDIDNIGESIQNFIETYLVRNIIAIARNRLLIDKSFRKNNDMLEKFFNLKEKLNFETDTIIGYRNIFYRETDRESDFREFEKGKNTITAPNCNQFIISIDSSKFYFEVKNVVVDIEKFNNEEIYKGIELNSNGEYLYNIINDIYLPFKKDELEQYISNRKRLVNISIDIEYGFTDEIIGIGIFTTNEK